MTLPSRIGNYRAGNSNNAFFVYGKVERPATPVIEITIDARYWFLLKKIHLLNYVSPTASTSPIDYQAQIYDVARSRYFQNIKISNNTIGGNVQSPHVLPAPVLFSPSDVIRIEMDRTPTRVYYALEGEHLVNPEPGWVKRMNSRSWFQYALLGVPLSGTINLDMRDDKHDFAIFQAISKSALDGVLSNANPGLISIREKGPKGRAWSNGAVPSINFGGAFGNGAGPRRFVPPLIVPLPTTLEIITDQIPNTLYQDLVLNGVKYPKGTKLEEWL